MNQLKYIKSLVEEYTGEDLNDISRKREVVSARWMYCYLAKSHTHYSDKVIGHPIKRDRASVICAYQRFMNRLRWEPKTAEIYNTLDELIKAEITNQTPKVNGIIQMLPKAGVDVVEQVYKLLRREKLNKKRALKYA